MASQGNIPKRFYPIEAKVLDSTQSQLLQTKILKMTSLGFIMQAKDKFYKTAEEFIMQFELPYVNVSMKVKVVVVKTFFHFNKRKEKELLVEMHFKDLSKEALTKITQFVTMSEAS